MPNLEEIELGAKVLAEGASAVGDVFRAELPGIFGAEAKTVGGRVAGSPFAIFSKAVQESGHTGLMSSLREFFQLPVEGRALLRGEDATRLTELLSRNTTEGLAKVHDELRTAIDLGKELPADRTGRAILADINQAGVYGHNPWVGDMPRLSGT